MTLKCIIVDDEPRAIDVLKEYTEQLSSLNLLATFRNSVEAFDFVKQNQVDVVFLDINMPNLSGIQFIKSLTRKPAIVLTTAYSEYAIESYQLDVLDYLLKPIEFDRFIKCVNRLFDKLNPLNTENKVPIETPKSTSKEYIFVKNGTKIERIELNDILYLEGSGNYVIYHTVNGKIMTLSTMGDSLETLPNHDFIRIHRSYIINWNKVKSVENNHVHIGDVKLSISISHKKAFFDRLNNPH